MPEKSDKRKELRRTARMPDAPALPPKAPDSEKTLPGDPPPVASRRTRGTDESAIEVVVVREDAVRDAPRQPWRAFEVWTRNRVYGLDASYRCIEVLDRTTGNLETDNSMLGARFGGGRRQNDTSVVYSYPFPLEGSEAMFISGQKYGCTSTVERLVIRVREFRVRSVDSPPTWDELAGKADGAVASKRPAK
jgi:hypothetical protein